MKKSTDHIITQEEAGTLHGLFLARVRRTPEAIAYRYFDLQQNAWLSYSWAQMRDQVARWQAALMQEGLAPGERVAVMLRNCPQWVMFDQAAHSLGLVVVPLYTVDRPDSVAYIVNDSGAKVLLFETDEQWQALRTVRDKMDCVQRFVALDKLSDEAEPRLKSADSWLPPAAQLQAVSSAKPGELATIIYTSGTTGKPKGVMLSHANILSNASHTLNTFPIYTDDLLLSFLPLSHTFERTLGYYLTVMTGATVAYARSVALLGEDLQTIRPTVLVSVPRIYERVYAAIHGKLEEGSPLKRKLFNLAVDVGWARFLHQQSRGSWKISFLLWPVLRHLVAKKILTKMGGRLRAAISGGAALSPQVSRLFVGLGLPVVQGYGLTETSPVISASPLENNFPDSAGRPISGLQVRIGEQNALMIKGPNVMMGYWNNPEATRAMIDADGWLNTGDTARISETGHIYITGRLKEIIVLSNGEKIPPTDMEIAIMRERLFDQVMVYGEGRPYLVVLAVVNPDSWKQLAAKIGVNAERPESLRDKRVEEQVVKLISAQIHEFPGYAQIHRVLLLSEPWSIENGMLTPTLKVKRAKVVEKYLADINALYEGH
jgi:long-chain acyl-CoA synthetase